MGKVELRWRPKTPCCTARYIVSCVLCRLVTTSTCAIAFSDACQIFVRCGVAQLQKFFQHSLAPLAEIVGRKAPSASTSAKPDDRRAIDCRTFGSGQLQCH